MFYNPQRVLAIFAHPDDAELSCFGTLAKLRDQGSHVQILNLTSGEYSKTANGSARKAECRAAAKLISCSVMVESLPDGQLGYNPQTVNLVESYLDKLSPDTIITHYPQTLGLGHQDHVNVSSSVVNAARRNANVAWILYAEPPTQQSNFLPNFYVDITGYLAVKQEAIRLYGSERTKTFMNPQIAQTKAHWWAMQVHPERHNCGQAYEAFIIVQSVI